MRRRCGDGCLARTRGFALAVALIALTAMSFAAALLARAVDTSSAVTASLALRTITLAATDGAIERAIAALADGGTIADHDRDAPALGYYASRQPGEDARGIPRALQQPARDAGANARVEAADNDTTLAYVIERLCLDTGPPTDAHCALYRTPGGGPPQVVYRLTVRADGAQEATAFVQASVRGTAPPRRVSWRSIAE